MNIDLNPKKRKEMYEYSLQRACNIVGALGVIHDLAKKEPWLEEWCQEEAPEVIRTWRMAVGLQLQLQKLIHIRDVQKPTRMYDAYERDE